uniref:Leucine rich repeat containing G protein-coupled receptor 5 n=1 Tax=Poecilia reticulata TaxID=8081 RepID=A0A3P9NFV8_POERE
MRGFGALLAVLAVLSVGLWSSEAGVRMQKAAAAAAGNSSGESREESSRAAGHATCPGRCRCEGDGLLHRVDCSDLGLREIPSNLSVFTSYLDLSMNNLTVMTSGALSNLHFLEELRLAGNDLSFVPRGAFSGLYNLKVLMLQNNQLRSVPAEAFTNLHNLQSLRLDANHISGVPPGCFFGLRSLRHLWLDDNALTDVPVKALGELPTLQAMTLALNHIAHIPDHAFSKLGRLVVLHLNNNRIVSMGNNCFHGLHSLETLDLNYNSLVEFPTAVRSLSHLKELGFHSNNIQSIPERAFTGNPSLISLLFYDNPIQSVGRSAFQNLPELRTLTVTGARITSLPSSMCEQLPNLQLLIFCVCSDLSSNQLSSLPLTGLQSLTRIRLVGNDQLMDLIFLLVGLGSVDQDWDDFLMEFEDEPKPQHSVHCSPTPGPFRPCLRLLGSWMIRGGVWLIAAISLVSNGLVVLSVFFSPASVVTPPKLLIGLLALVNGLMGVWSGWLAAVDAWTFGSFWRYGVKWESSFLCRLSGFLCVFASQTGLFLLTVAALERCLSAAGATQSRSSSPLFIRLSIFLCFLLGFVITLPPLMAGHSSSSFCLPLPSSSSSSSSLAFAVSLVLFDSLCFLVMTLAYTRLYCRASKAPPNSDDDAALTRHVAWLLFSDCLLYLPVAFLSFSSLLRLPAAGPEAAKGVLLLVTPLPACVNPLLYLLFNPLARGELAALAARACRGAAASKLQRRGVTGGRPLDSTYDEDAEKQSCDSTQALVVVEGVKEEEEQRSKTQQSLSAAQRR